MNALTRKFAVAIDFQETLGFPWFNYYIRYVLHCPDPVMIVVDPAGHGVQVGVSELA